MVGLGRNFSGCRNAIYLGGVQIRIPYLQSSFEVSSSGTSINEQTGKKLHRESCVQFQTRLWYMQEFWKRIFILHECIRQIMFYRFYQSKI